MSLEDKIKEVLFNIGKEIKVHKMPNGHLILDIDYDKYVSKIIEVIKEEN